MIEYEYRLRRDEGNETNVYVPRDIPTSLPNLVLIEAPNSAGKTMLLNILALGFHGLKTDRLDPALRERLQQLVESEHQSLEFKITLTDDDGAVLLKAGKAAMDKPEIVVRKPDGEREKILTAELFQRNYNLIYDIPENPTERLTQLVSEIHEDQNLYANRVGSLRSTIYRLITEVKDSRDPNQLKNLADTIKRNGELVKDLTREKVRLIVVRKLVDQLRVARGLSDARERWDRVDSEIKKLSKQLKDERTKGKKVNTKMRRLRGFATSAIDGMKDIHRSTTSILKAVLPKSERENLNMWERIDFDRSLRDLEFNDIPDTLVRRFRGLLQKMVEDNRPKMVGATVYRELIEFLRRYQDTNVVLPGLDKTVDEFIVLLEETYREYEAMGILQKRIREAFEGFDELDKERRRASKLLLDLRTMTKKYPDEEAGFPTADESEVRLLRLSEEFDKLADKCSRLEGVCRNKGIDVDQLDSTLQELERDEILDPFRLYDVNELGRASATLGADVDSRSQRISDLETDTGYQKRVLSRLKKKKPHRYQDRLTELSDLHQKCLRLEQRLSKEFAEYLTALTRQEAPARPTKASNTYFDEVAKYLGRKLGSIRHIDKVYSVERIDLLEGLVHAKGGTVIRLADMGTGQSQSAYLLGLLSTNDPRTIIALFDEIAMMDSTSLEPIFRKLNELYESNRLLAAVMVQRGDEVKVEPIPNGGMR